MRQNRNFNFQNVSSANEKMLIILSWIIVVIIIVLIGLYYGQHTREQEITLAKIDSRSDSGVEVSADSDRKVEEGEMKASRETGSVLTDTLTLNKNELYTVQIGSREDGEYLDDARAEEIKREYSNKNIYAQKIISDPDRRQNILHIGLFKNFEEAKALLNSVKLKNFPARITITVDPKTEIAFIPKSAQAKNPSEVVVSTTDSKAVESVKTASGDEDAAKKIQKIDLPVPAPVPAQETKASQIKEEAQPAPSAVQPAGSEKSAQVVVEKVTPPAAPARPAADVGAKKGVFTVKPASSSPEVSPVSEAPVEDTAEASPAAEIPEKTGKIGEDDSAEPSNPPVESKVATTVKNTPEVKVVVISKNKKAAAEPPKKPAKPAAVEKDSAEDDILADESEPDSATESPKKPAEKKSGKFYIQLGTYKSSGNADILKKKVEEAGYSNVSIVPGKSPNGDSVYRVRLEGYSSKDDATSESGKLKSKVPEVTSAYISK